MTEIDTLRDEIKDLRKTVANLQMGKKEKRHRPPSEFNKFVGDKIKEIKAKNPGMSHKDVFSEAVKMWNKLKGKK